MTTLQELIEIDDRIAPDTLPATAAGIADIENKMIEAIEAAGLPGRITPADLDALTARNFHTIRRAAEKALQRA